MRTALLAVFSTLLLLSGVTPTQPASAAPAAPPQPAAAQPAQAPSVPRATAGATPPAAPAAPSPPPPPPDVTIPFHKYILPNGLTLIIHEDHKAPIVAVDVWYH